jgi:integrase
MPQKLDDRFCCRVAPPSDGSPYALHYDTVCRRFALRVTKAGFRSFVLNYRSHGVERRLTIGSFPDWPANLARKEAQKLKRWVDQGRDPQAERHAERRAPSVAALFERYFAEHAIEPKKRLASIVEDKAIYAKWIDRGLGNRKVVDIKRADIERLHRQATGEAPIRANRMLSLLSTAFGLAVRWELRSDNPAKAIDRNREQARQRYLSGDELARLNAFLDRHSDQRLVAVIRLLLLTGARRNEVCGLRWAELDLVAGIWTKSAMRTKSRREHRVPLSQAAVAILVGLRRAQTKLSPYVFPTAGRAGHLRDLRGWRELRAEAGLCDVRIHDLRHSHASLLANAGMSLPMIAALLGHASPSTTARYAHLADSALRVGVEALGQVVAGPGR